ncbi:hypothetical protein A6A04_07035 [Paramagnetospirillum marisnigri]|uniref:ABC transporter substrate-binding protein n=1 Tax=Paramagnetospirillum marisnigri TaxID=1285242 RepID=A0A178MA57_9PROT|nr:ABC transporter substrate-binding protein [Paramagnetospirillum marisnigri]OAN45642.1 hypothetical protein A6A04_07035 [Paramagnetospirillum marisnigri]
MATIRGVLLVVLAVIGLMAPVAVRPAMAVEVPVAETLVRAVVADANATLGGGPHSVVEKRARLSALVEKYADISYESELLLGRYWRKASSAQQEAFTGLLVPFFVATYGEMVDAADVKPDVVFLGADPSGDAVQVRTQLVTQGQNPVDVKWLVAQAPSGKVVVADIVADGVSIITTLKSDFTSVVRMGGGNLDVLLDAMRKKIGG